MSMKENYEKKLQAQLDEWKADIDKLKAKANKAKADVQIDYTRQIEELQAMREAVGEKLTELNKASDEAWEDIKDGIESSKKSLSNALKSAISKFQ